MKHIYKNLMIWVVSLFGMSLTAQTVAAGRSYAA